MNMSNEVKGYLGDLRIVVVNTKTRQLPDHTVIRKPNWDYSFGSAHLVEALADGMSFVTIETIGHRVLEYSDITMNDIWDMAEKNTKNATVIMDVLDILLGSNEPLQFAGMIRHLRAGCFLSLTNRDGSFGAGGIAVSRNLLEKLATAIEDDIILIPSSIHEVLVVPASIMEGREDEIPNIIGEVNVDPGKIRRQDVLGDKPYYIRLEDI